MKNEVTIVGRISSQFTNDHDFYGEKYYRVIITVTRDSGTDDNIPVIISERLVNLSEYPVNTNVIVKGQYRSYNLHNKNNVKLMLYVFATDLELLSYKDNYNEIYLEGYLNKPPIYRQTPLGREITDLILNVPRAYGKSDRIPCVCWGKSAKYVSKLEVGDYIRVAGRVQSRQYLKDGETKTAYEVSVNLVEIMDNDEESA